MNGDIETAGRAASMRYGALVLAAVALAAMPAQAENIDPGDDGSQLAYGENVGWINAEPLGDGGPGLQVGEFDVAGWMYGENIGWISFSCENTSTCGTTGYGVVNDGGVLGGYAWTENGGWMSLSCENTGSCGASPYGVTIDTTTGAFGGRAWTENMGWVSFASTEPGVHGVRTAWTCVPPAAVASLAVAPLGADAELSWAALPGATAYDVVTGDLETLRTSGGDFTVATTACAEDNLFGTSSVQPGDPPIGGGMWFLVRGANCGGGTYESGGSGQGGTRDPEVETSGAACQ
ncbi:MAG: hypothetical protein PVF68_11240 [Acidobacteriota bacterium]|jgi:hypothetical protein